MSDLASIDEQADATNKWKKGKWDSLRIEKHIDIIDGPLNVSVRELHRVHQELTDQSDTRDLWYARQRGHFQGPDRNT